MGSQSSMHLLYLSIYCISGMEGWTNVKNARDDFVREKRPPKPLPETLPETTPKPLSTPRTTPTYESKYHNTSKGHNILYSK